jgi:LacI family fructose operon transcriptional repressor
MDVPQKNTRPTLKEIAKYTGFGLSTVSLALRNDPKLRKTTGDSIREAAQRLGYVPNPLVSALMTQVRNKRVTRSARIALISRLKHGVTRSSSQNIFYSSLYQSIVKHAESRGFGIDEFYLGCDKLSDARLADILKARGIHGILLFPGSHDPKIEYPELPWGRFSTVLIGHNTLQNKLHQVVPDYSFNIDCALDHTQAQGETKIGFAVTRAVNQATNRHWSSRFLLYQNSISKRHRVPMLLSESDSNFRSELVGWYHKYRPEVLLIAGEGAHRLLVRNGVRIPDDVQLVNLVQRGEVGLAGIAPNTDQVGHVAVEFLVSLLETNKSGLPPVPQTIAIKGHWRDGPSFL